MEPVCAPSRALAGPGVDSCAPIDKYSLAVGLDARSNIKCLNGDDAATQAAAKAACDASTLCKVGGVGVGGVIE